ncbi:MAG: peptidylprolyl isomerase [Oligoflexia bacterium]|nr:peptidylprolyl isomerase [Oligoflexia bacterium]
MIKAGKVVELKYSLKNTKGEILDQADANDPFSYLHGAEQIVPGLESALEGLKVGDKKDVVVSPEEGYGPKSEELRLLVNRSQFPKDMDLKPGMSFEADTGGGHGMAFTVESVSGDKVQLDGNHPLAGETLHFAVEVLKVRDATDEEKDHGHSHSGDGHHHH